MLRLSNFGRHFSVRIDRIYPRKIRADLVDRHRHQYDHQYAVYSDRPFKIAPGGGFVLLGAEQEVNRVAGLVDGSSSGLISSLTSRSGAATVPGFSRLSTSRSPSCIGYFDMTASLLQTVAVYARNPTSNGAIKIITDGTILRPMRVMSGDAGAMVLRRARLPGGRIYTMFFHRPIRWDRSGREACHEPRSLCLRANTNLPDNERRQFVRRPERYRQGSW